ncbi:hypothetical protein C8J56DRAFT_846393 [Mycena floridula]|nr:hypothetical protein C8J56DRAFT_846393 [Mycena floridula]
MLQSIISLAVLSGHLLLVNAHAKVGPVIRQPGPAFLAACGKPSFDSVTGDPTGHIEEQEPVNAGCELTLCRGMLFADQPASNVVQATAAQAMSFDVDCTIPHGGPANVSLIDTTVGGSGERIGDTLVSFDNFCPTSGGTPADQTKTQFTLPDAATIGNKCANAGDCVVQLFWGTPDLSQNYYYCMDLVVAAAAVTSTSSVVQVTPTTSSIVDAIPTSSTVDIIPTSSVESSSAEVLATSSAVEVLTSAAVATETPTTTSPLRMSTTFIDVTVTASKAAATPAAALSSDNGGTRAQVTFAAIVFGAIVGGIAMAF